ncbi:hypothetical protein C6P46_006145 [Rhodotorula mucilaginosa]|uniref:Autophagy-related protein 14 n=1 Tax=Rhodotorula mucilaginosa TaxID=5537 RepID=A0A9P6VZ84_RHOMI|nr:hypothetical protein C6P46_006145 [Rhodotorula mucilaginosa]TKA55694.1 hypothetical protein B0A53_02830 [Rhodotorula sp. CCFEE 5036]
MVLTRSDSAASVWVLPPLAPDADGNYAIPDHRQLAQLCAVCVHNLALEPPLPSPAVGAAALDQDRRSLDWTAGGAIPTSQCDRDREGIRPLAGPSSSSNGAYHGPRRKRAASTATVAGEWAGAPAPTPDRILSSSSTVPSPPPPPPAFRRSVSAGMISTRGNNNTTRSSTIITAAAAPPASSTIDEEQEVTTSPAVAVVAADGPSEVARPSDSTIPTRRLRSTSRASVASSSGSTSTIRAAPRIPLRPPSDIVAGPSAASRQPQSTDSRPSQRRRAKQPKTRIPVPLVESFVSLELLPPLAAPDADGASVTEAATSKKMSTTRSRSGSVRSVFGGVGGGAAAAPSMSRSGSTGSVRGVAASSSSSSSSAIPSPRKRMRRRTISSAALFAPLPTLASLAAGNGANKSASPTTATETDDRADDDQGHPFYVSDVADPATHATFFLDPENCFLPSGPTTTTTNVDGDPTAPRNKDDCPRIAAFPEEIQDWPGWRQSRFKATLWGRREEEEGAKSRDRTAGRNGKQRQEMPNPPPAVAATSSSDGWRVLVEWEVDLAGLTSLGRDPTDFPELPPNTLVFALSSDGGVVSSFPPVDPSTSSSSGLSANLPPADHLEYFTAPIPLLQRAYRRRLRAARRARIATLQHQHQQPHQQRSWSEDELSDYLDCCYESDCSSCEEGEGRRSDVDDDDEDGVTGGHASDPGVVSQARMAGMLVGGGGRKRSDTIRSRRAAAGMGRRGGTIISLRNGGPNRTRYHHHQTVAEEEQQLRRQARLRAAEEVLEKSRRETRMVRAAGWDEIRRLCEARWELERGSREVKVAREAVERALGADDETGWAAQERFRSELQDRLDDLEGVKEAVEAELSEEQHELDIRAALLRQRRQRLEKAKQLETARLEQLDRNSTLLDGVSQEVADLAHSTQTRQTQLITLLSHIFPIEPVPTAPRGVSPDLLFSILGIALPNSTFPSSYSDDLASSALGYAAQVTQLLAAYLAVPVAYPITCRGSRSYLRDEISMMKGSRAFPLFAKGVDRYRFDYAVFLLNKNIEQGLTVLDLRNTLPNLMTLMLSLSYDPSHDDYLASTLLPTGPFADQPPSPVAVDDVEDARVASADDDEASSLLRPNGTQGEERASTRTRSSRSGSNASTIRPSRPQENTETLISDVGDPGTSSAPASDAAASLAEPRSSADAGPAPTPTSRSKGRRLRRRSSSSASEKVTLVTTVQKAAAQQHDRSSSSGSTASSIGSGGGGTGYGAKLGEGLWTVVAGSAGRRESSGPREAATPAEDRSHAAPATTS